MSSMDTAAIAAALTDDILENAVGATGDDNAARALAERAAATEGSSDAPPAADAADTPADTAELPDYTPIADDDLDALLEEPDFAEEAAAEVQADLESGELDPDLDPAVAKELRELKKRNAWLEQQNILKSKKGWVAENLRKYPLLKEHFAAEVGKIDATSRRQFALKAKDLNDQMAGVLSKPLADIAAQVDRLKATATVEARAEVQQAWGSPAQEQAVVPTSLEIADELDRARKAGVPLAERFKILGGVSKRGR